MRQVRREQLERDRAIELDVVRLEHDAHAAAADDALDVVAAEPTEHFGMTRRIEKRFDTGMRCI